MAKKYNSAYDGTPIQIKRTQLSLDDTTQKAKINNDYIGRDATQKGLKYGEPLYLDYTDAKGNEVDYLTIGKNPHVDTSDLKVFKAIPRQYAEGTLFFDQDTREDISNRVNLIDQTGTNIYTKLRIFSIRDKDGISVDKEDISRQMVIPASNKDISVTDWYKVDATGKPSTTDKASMDDFPKAYRLKVTNMTADTVPYIGLALNNVQLGNKALAKAVQKAFSNVTSVESYYNSASDCGLLIYCCYKNLRQDCYIDVFGG